MGQSHSKVAPPPQTVAPETEKVPNMESSGKDAVNINSIAAAEEKKECPWKPSWMKNKGASDTACPITGKKPESASDSTCPVMAKTNDKPKTSQDDSACPVLNNEGASSVTYNVYSQPIDPNNQMPASAVINQLPAPNQVVELSTDRMKSSIPKGGASDGMTWMYPSPQMFYNALARKGKLNISHENAEEEQSMMETVVNLHNTMNETTWYKVLEWERLVQDEREVKLPKLLKFCGRPSELSPKARLKYWMFGHPLPFDRHDWTLVRPNGEQVRYVIDYYYQNTKGEDKEGGAKQILVDVRPALDNPQSLYQRAVNMPMARRALCPSGLKSKFEPLPLIPTKDLKNELAESENVWKEIQEHGRHLKKRLSFRRTEEPEEVPVISEKEAKALSLKFAHVIKDCQRAQKVFDEACAKDDEAICAQASLALTMCLAKIMCPVQHQAIAKSVHAENVNQDEYDLRVDTALENATLCINGNNERVALARQQHPDLFTSTK